MSLNERRPRVIFLPQNAEEKRRNTIACLVEDTSNCKEVTVKLSDIEHLDNLETLKYIYGRVKSW